jgi:hypothetical protein
VFLPRFHRWARIVGVTLSVVTMPLHASVQADKLRLGKIRSSTVFLSSCVLVHVSLYPLVVSIVARKDANIGALEQIVPKLQAALSPLQKQAELYE